MCVFVCVCVSVRVFMCVKPLLPSKALFWRVGILRVLHFILRSLVARFSGTCIALLGELNPPFWSTFVALALFFFLLEGGGGVRGGREAHPHGQVYLLRVSNLFLKLRHSYIFHTRPRARLPSARVYSSVCQTL